MKLNNLIFTALAECCIKTLLFLKKVVVFSEKLGIFLIKLGMFFM